MTIITSLKTQLNLVTSLHHVSTLIIIALHSIRHNKRSHLHCQQRILPKSLIQPISNQKILHRIIHYFKQTKKEIKGTINSLNMTSIIMLQKNSKTTVGKVQHQLNNSQDITYLHSTSMEAKEVLKRTN